MTSTNAVKHTINASRVFAIPATAAAIITFQRAHKKCSQLAGFLTGPVAAIMLAAPALLLLRCTAAVAGTTVRATRLPNTRSTISSIKYAKIHVCI